MLVSLGIVEPRENSRRHERTPRGGYAPEFTGKSGPGHKGDATPRQGRQCRTISISLPDALKSFVDQQVRSRGYRASSEYVRELIRRDQGRQRLRGLLLKNATSPLAIDADATYFGQLRDGVREPGQRLPKCVSLLTSFIAGASLGGDGSMSIKLPTSVTTRLVGFEV